MNLAFRESRGEFVAFLDDDDIFYPRHLDTLLFFLRNVPGLRMAVSDTEKVLLRQDTAGRVVEAGREIIYHRQIGLGDLLDKNEITWLSVMCRRELFEEVGGLDEGLRAFLDHDLWRRMASRAYPYHVTAVTAEYYLREYADEEGRGQITHMSVSDPPRYLANRMRVLNKRLVGDESPLYPVWERLRREGRHEFLIARARRFREQGRLGRCRVSLAQAARRGFNLAATWRELGVMELESGDQIRALAAFRRCIACEGQSCATDHLYMALAHLQLRQPAQALECLVCLDADKDANARVRNIGRDYRLRAMRLLAEQGATAGCLSWAGMGGLVGQVSQR